MAAATWFFCQYRLLCEQVAGKGENTMIYDNFSNLSAYKGFSKGLDKVIEWAKTHKVEIGRAHV